MKPGPLDELLKPGPFHESWFVSPARYRPGPFRLRPTGLVQVSNIP